MSQEPGLTSCPGSLLAGPGLSTCPGVHEPRNWYGFPSTRIIPAICFSVPSQCDTEEDVACRHYMCVHASNDTDARARTVSPRIHVWVNGSVVSKGMAGGLNCTFATAQLIASWKVRSFNAAMTFLKFYRKFELSGIQVANIRRSLGFKMDCSTVRAHCLQFFVLCDSL